MFRNILEQQSLVSHTAVYFLPACQEREAEDDYLRLSGGGAEPSTPAAEAGWWRGQQQPVW